MASNQKKLDLASIVIIVVSILLILSGFFLLNKNYSKQSLQPTTKSSSSSSLSISSSTSTKSISTSTISSSSVSESFSVSSSSSSSSSSSTSLSSMSSSSSLSSREKSKLSSSEAVVKVVSIDGSRYEIEVLDTGYENGKLWKVGEKLKVNIQEFDAQIGKEYKLTGISEKGNYTSFDLITDNK
jgi:hypothetical protein